MSTPDQKKLLEDVAKTLDPSRTFAFLGIPETDMDRDDLIIIVRWLAEDNKALFEKSLHYLNLVSTMRRSK